MQSVLTTFVLVLPHCHEHNTTGMTTDNIAQQNISPQASLLDDTKNGFYGSLSGLHVMGQIEASSHPRQGEKDHETSNVSAVEVSHSNSKPEPEPEPEPAASTVKYCARHIPKKSAPETAAPTMGVEPRPTPTAGARIEILQQNECFEEIDGQYECTGTLAVYRS